MPERLPELPEPDRADLLLTDLEADLRRLCQVVAEAIAAAELARRPGVLGVRPCRPPEDPPPEE